MIRKPWVRKNIEICLVISGLDEGKGDSFNKLVTMYHIFMILPVLTYSCLGMGGSLLHLGGQLDDSDIVMPFIYGLIISSTLSVIYCLSYQKNRAVSCMENQTKELRCSSPVDEASEWENHRMEFQCFIFLYELGLMTCAFLTCIVSPIIRFGFQTGTSFVVMPTWYPVDMLASPGRFWFAFFWEAISFSYMCFIHAAIGILFLYAMMTTKVRLIVLQSYLKNTAVWPDSEPRLSDEPPMCIENEFTKGMTTRPSMPRLKEWIGDLTILRRQKKSLNSTFTSWITAAHLVAMLTAATTSFGALSEIRSSGGVTINALTDAAYCATAFAMCFIITYYANILQETHDQVCSSLWESEWLSGERKFKKLFLNCEILLKYTLPLKAYTIRPVTLNFFATSLFNAWSVFLCLYHRSKDQLKTGRDPKGAPS